MPAPQPAPPVRAFVAAELPTALLRKIEAHQERLERKTASGQVRWTPSAQIHLTLKFYGSVASDELEVLREALETTAQRFAPMHLSLRGLGCFPSWQRPSVIWIGIEGDVEPLGNLQAAIESETAQFGSHSETREFHPHLTIGRVRLQGSAGRRIGEALRSETPIEPEMWKVDEIALIQSQLTPRGSIYSRLAIFPLRSGRQSGPGETPITAA